MYITNTYYLQQDTKQTEINKLLGLIKKKIWRCMSSSWDIKDIMYVLCHLERLHST